MQSTPTNNEQMTSHLNKVCVNLVCFISKRIKEMCEKLTEIQYQYKKALHEPVGVMRKHQIIILIF